MVCDIWRRFMGQCGSSVLCPMFRKGGHNRYTEFLPSKSWYGGWSWIFEKYPTRAVTSRCDMTATVGDMPMITLGVNCKDQAETKTKVAFHSTFTRHNFAIQACFKCSVSRRERQGRWRPGHARGLQRVRCGNAACDEWMWLIDRTTPTKTDIRKTYSFN